MDFEILGDITRIDVIASGNAIRDIARIRKQYGIGRWRKLKGIANVRLSDGQVLRAEIQWYEAHCIGRRKFKIKRFLDEQSPMEKSKTKSQFVVCIQSEPNLEYLGNPVIRRLGDLANGLLGQ
jgi:hypothetical protein